MTKLHSQNRVGIYHDKTSDHTAVSRPKPWS